MTNWTLIGGKLMKKRKGYQGSTRVNISRRDFLQGAGTGLLASEVAPTFLGKANVARSQVGAGLKSPVGTVRFTPSQGLTEISPNLYLHRDTCNVYVLKDGNHALLIDFGSGHILNLLGQIGITKVDAVLHTHHHRDQCQGDTRAVAERIPIKVPQRERHLFEDAENFWRNRRVFHLYYVKNDFLTITRNIPVAEGLRDYDTYRWGPFELLIYPTPAHTVGSISLVGTVDGRKTAFTGDLIHSPGKVLNLYDLQYQYNDTDGLDVVIFSLTRLRDLEPELICPSHGEPFTNPTAGMTDLINKIKDWLRSYMPSMGLTVENKPFAVTPHLIASSQTTSSFYALISDSGKALFVDYGSASGNFFNAFMQATPVLDRMRFVEHTIPELKARYGLKSVDVAMPSHMHDDHLNGFPHLARHYGTKIWCYENMADILQNPRGNNLGCILAEPIKVDRTFRHGESFKWEEFEFKVFHSPGHTEFQMAMFGEIDGARVAFTGDAFIPTSPLRPNLIFRNWVEKDSHLRSMRTILDNEPNIIAPGHGRPIVANKEDLEDLYRLLEKQARYFSDVIADHDCNFGLNPSWVRLYPYQLLAKAGASPDLELRVRNYRAQPMRLDAALVVPGGWQVSPEVVSLTVSPNDWGTGRFALTIPENWDRSAPRVAIAADVVADGQYLGEIAEGVVDIQFEG